MTGSSKATLQLCLDSCELTTPMKTYWWQRIRGRFLSDSLCLRKARCRVVMSRPQLECICISNTESTPGVESGEQYPGTGHKIVHFAPVLWYTGQTGPAFVNTCEKFVFLPTIANLIFSIHMSGYSMPQICVLLLHSRPPTKSVVLQICAD